MDEERKMKILVVSHEFPPIGGGGANACFYLTKGFVDKGHQVTLITANYQNMPQTEREYGVEIIRVASLRKHREHCSFTEMMSYLWKALPMASRFQKKEKFDLCLVFFGIPSGPIGYVLKKRYKLPYVIRFGGGDVPGFQERFTKLYRLLGPAIKAIWRNADILVANSQGLKDMALRFYNKKDFTIVCNGVDTDTFYPISKENTDEFRILFASRLIARKGLQYIIPELKKIQEKTDKKVKLVVVGNGPYRDYLEELTRKYAVEMIVQFEGQKDRQEIVAYYQNADVFILPSQKEGMPNVVLEAMACGLPIIMTPCEGSHELIKENGYVVPVEDFSEKLIFLANQSDLCRSMGEKSKKIVDSYFSWDSKVAEYIQIFQSCER